MAKFGKYEEVDAIGQAIIGTELEIAGNAWGIEDTDPLDETGDRSLEAMGEGLEGQIEAEDEDETADDASGEETETEGDEEAEGEDGEGEGEPTGDEPTTRPAATEQPEGRVPSSRLRQEAEARRQLETERNELRAEIERLKTGGSPELAQLRTELAAIQQQLKATQPAQVQQQPAAETPPDLFENPDGYRDYQQNVVKTEVGKVLDEVRRVRVETSFELADVRHPGVIPKAMEAIGKLNPTDPSDRATVQRIYSSPNPGEALVQWHKRNEALSRVGNDPAAYEARIREETRQALLADPEFKRQLLADMRGEALNAGDGQPRTTTSLPKSLARAGGSNVGADRMDHGARDDSDQAVANSAWR